MAGRYAEGTEVPVEKSKMEIESTVRRYGAESFVSGYDRAKAMVQFQADGRLVRFVIEVPAPAHQQFAHDGRGNNRPPEARIRAAAAEEKRLWRALLLAIKAKLEVVESGIATFEEEFLAHIVLPDGRQVGEWLAPQVKLAYDTGEMPSLLALGTGS